MSTTLCKSIKVSTELMFANLPIAMKTCDWQADVCGVPTWRYIYHTIHSCDKFFINPTIYEEPPFHIPGIDWPDHPTTIILTKEQLDNYYIFVHKKMLEYLDRLTDDKLNEIPDGCVSSRIELILSQYRHMYAHIGIINGITIIKTEKYPRILNESHLRRGEKLDELYDDDIRTVKE